jgi:hypothetical protein
MRITRNGNAPTWGGWLFLALGAGVLFLRGTRAEADPSERFALAAIAAVLAAAGALVVIRAYRQTLTVQPELRRIVVEERTRFGTRSRVVRFDEVRAVAVEEQVDPDPDARPFERSSFRVVLRLRDGTSVPVTDFAPDAERSARTQDEIVRALG